MDLELPQKGSATATIETTLDQVTPTAHMVEALNSPPKSGLDLEALSKLTKVLEDILQLYCDFGFNRQKYDLKRSLKQWVRMCEEIPGPDPWVKLAKYKTAAFFASHSFDSDGFRQTLPVRPFTVEDNPGVLLGGAAGRWVSRKVLHPSRSIDFRTTFITSVLYLKKGLPRPGKKFLRKAEQDTFNKLFKDPVVFPEDQPVCDSWADRTELDERKVCTLITKENLIKEIKRTVKEVLTDHQGRRIRMTMDDIIRPYFPSTSANYIRSRDGAGSVGFIMEDPHLLKGLQGAKIELKEVEEEYPDDVADISILFGEDLPPKGKIWVADDGPLYDAFQRLWDRCLFAAHEEEPVVEILALAEALKARPITKGPPLMGFVLKPVQKFVWRILSQHPVFKLVGEPVSEKLLLDRLGKILQPGERWNSGDYADATNEMFSFCSEAAAEELSDIFADLPHEYQFMSVLLRRSLTGHWCVDPSAPKIGDEQEASHQLRGQLMGSITSFVVLCLVNAAICRWSLEVSRGRRLTLRSCPLLINGDDCGFPLNERGIIAWRRIAAASGMKESIGKSYWSSEFLNINSTTYRMVEPYRFYDIRREHGEDIGVERMNVWKLVRYVNYGLVNGMTRSSNKMETSDLFGGYESIGSRGFELQKLTPPWLWAKIYPRFLNNVKKMSSEQLKVPWFVPNTIGGLGLPPPSDEYWSKKFMDCRLSRKVAEGKFGEPRSFIPAASWLTHQRVMSRLPGKRIDCQAGDSVWEKYQKNWDRLYGALCVEQLFVSTKKQLFRPGQKSAGMRTLRNNERVWYKAYHSHNKHDLELPEGIEEYDPWKEIKKVSRVLPCKFAESLSGSRFHLV
jgi:hypothetical protein